MWFIGLYEINRLFDRLAENGQFSQEWIIRLHSSLTPEEQSRAFLNPPSYPSLPNQNPRRVTIADLVEGETTGEELVGVGEKKIRKIVLATNIAETSLTIDDVVYVIDTGRFRERRFDAVKGISALVEDWISKASVKQRKGRAGRVSEGVCFSLFTRFRFDRLMASYQVPEIKRMPLEETVLQVR